MISTRSPAATWSVTLFNALTPVSGYVKLTWLTRRSPAMGTLQGLVPVFMLGLIFKNSFIEEEIEFDDKYSLIFDGNTRSRRVITKLKINDVTTYILKRK